MCITEFLTLAPLIDLTRHVAAGRWGKEIVMKKTARAAPSVTSMPIPGAGPGLLAKDLDRRVRSGAHSRRSFGECRR